MTPERPHHRTTPGLPTVRSGDNLVLRTWPTSLSDLNDPGDGWSPSATSVARSPRGRGSVEFGEDLTDDLRRLMSGEEFAALGLFDLGGEVLHRVDATDQNM